jgi:hypothetical protein
VAEGTGLSFDVKNQHTSAAGERHTLLHGRTRFGRWASKPHERLWHGGDPRILGSMGIDRFWDLVLG